MNNNEYNERVVSMNNIGLVYLGVQRIVCPYCKKKEQDNEMSSYNTNIHQAFVEHHMGDEGVIGSKNGENDDYQSCIDSVEEVMNNFKITAEEEIEVIEMVIRNMNSVAVVPQRLIDRLNHLTQTIRMNKTAAYALQKNIKDDQKKIVLATENNYNEFINLLAEVIHNDASTSNDILDVVAQYSVSDLPDSVLDEISKCINDRIKREIKEGLEVVDIENENALTDGDILMNEEVEPITTHRRDIKNVGVVATKRSVTTNQITKEIVIRNILQEMVLGQIANGASSRDIVNFIQDQAKILGSSIPNTHKCNIVKQMGEGQNVDVNKMYNRLSNAHGLYALCIITSLRNAQQITTLPSALDQFKPLGSYYKTLVHCQNLTTKKEILHYVRSCGFSHLNVTSKNSTATPQQKSTTVIMRQQQHKCTVYQPQLKSK